MEHTVLKSGLNPSVRNFTRSFTHRVFVSIKKYLTWLSTSVEKQGADVCGSLMHSWISFDKSEWGQKEKRQITQKTTVEIQNASVGNWWQDNWGFSLSMRCLYSPDWKIFFSGWNMTKMEDLGNWELENKKNKLSRITSNLANCYPIGKNIFWREKYGIWTLCLTT